MEKLAIPGVGAIIEKTIDETKYILIQERQKEDESTDNGMLEIPAGKIREYENIFQTLRREVMEETGLTITKIHGEEQTIESTIGGNRVISFTPFHVTQNFEDIKEMLIKNPEQFFLMHINALKKYFQLV